MRLMRGLASFLLVTQLIWLAAPALCLMPGTAACHETGPEGGADHRSAPAAPLPAGCSMPAHCGTQVPAAVSVSITVADGPPGRRYFLVDVPGLLPADPVAPPLPPPQS